MRDTDFIWGVGRVTLIIEPMGKETLYVVHFEGKASSEDEVIYKSSERIAKHGTFTSRKEIPSWHISKSKEGQKVLILRNQILQVNELLSV